MTEQRILFDEGRTYLLEKPFVKQIGFADVLEFNPMPLENRKSPLDIIQANESNRFAKASENIGLSCISGIVKTSKNQYKLFLESEGEDEEDFDAKYLTGATLELEEGIEHLFENGTMFHNLEQTDDFYIDFRMRINLAKELAIKYNLTLPNNSSLLFVTTGNISRLSDLDRVLDLGYEYNEHINSEGFNLRVEELQASVREGMIRLFLE